MAREPDGRPLLTGEPAADAALFDAFKALAGNRAFEHVCRHIAERLTAVDEANRVRGQENQRTEAQAWSAFLGCKALGEKRGKAFAIPLEATM